MTLIQDTRVGSALRETLSLDGAGQVRLDMSDSVVPVVVVGDVSESVALDKVNMCGYNYRPAVAAQYPRIAFEVQANTALKEVYLKRLEIYSDTAQPIFLGFSGVLVGPNVTAVPQRNRFGNRTAPVFSRVIGDTSATIWNDANYSKRINLLAGTMFVLDFSEAPIIMDVMTQGALYVIHGTAANSNLSVNCEWEEVPRVN